MSIQIELSLHIEHLFRYIYLYLYLLIKKHEAGSVTERTMASASKTISVPVEFSQNVNTENQINTELHIRNSTIMYVFIRGFPKFTCQI